MDARSNQTAHDPFPPRTSLDPNETTGSSFYSIDLAMYLDNMPDWQRRRHADWEVDRLKVLAELIAQYRSKAQILRFLTCGTEAKLWQNEKQPEKYRVTCNKCRNRWCAPCQRDKGWSLAQKLKGLMKPKTCRFITLTLNSGKEPLRKQLDRLLKCFKALRSEPIWKSTQRGGIAFVEATYNASEKRWHPHIHILSDGKYIMDGHLSQAWKKVTGDSYITHVRFVHSQANALKYVTQYVTSGLGIEVFNHPEALMEAMRDLGGFHMVVRYGTWSKGTQKFKHDPTEWKLLGWHQQLLDESRKDYPYAELAVRVFFNRDMNLPNHDP